MFWNGRTAIDGLSGSGQRRRRSVSGVAGAPCALSEQDAIDAHRPGDVLDLLLAQVVERDVELVAHLVVHRPG